MTGPALVLAMSTPVPAQVPMHPPGDPGTAPTASEDASAPAAPAPRGGGARARVEDEAGAPAPAFADLLLAPPAPAVPPPPAAPGNAAAAETAAGPAPLAPGQLLAMLAGRQGGAGPLSGQATATLDGAPAAPAGTGTPGLPLAGEAAPALDSLPAPVPPGPAAAPPLASALDAAGPAAVPVFALATGAAAEALQEAAAEAAGGPAAVADAPDTLLAGAQPAPPPRAAPPAPQLPPMAMPAQPSDGFDEGFGARIAWMAEQRLGHAEIRLNPEHVGRIDVRIELDGHQVRAEFSSAHAEVRQAIEASLPRLREMLGQHGLELGQTDVGQHRDGQAGAAGTRGQADGRAATGDAVADADPPGTAAPARMRGLVDAYA